MTDQGQKDLKALLQQLLLCNNCGKHNELDDEHPIRRLISLPSITIHGSVYLYLVDTSIFFGSHSIDLAGKAQALKTVKAFFASPDKMLNKRQLIEGVYGEKIDNSRSPTYWESRGNSAVKQLQRTRALFCQEFTNKGLNVKWFPHIRHLDKWALFQVQPRQPSLNFEE